VNSAEFVKLPLHGLVQCFFNWRLMTAITKSSPKVRLPTEAKTVSIPKCALRFQMNKVGPPIKVVDFDTGEILKESLSEAAAIDWINRTVKVYSLKASANSEESESIIYITTYSQKNERRYRNERQVTK